MRSTAAALLEAQGDQPFGRTVPTLLAFGHCPLAFEHFDTRVATLLRNAKVITWADVARLSPNDVRSWPGAGDRAVARLVEAILKALVDPMAFIVPEPPVRKRAPSPPAERTRTNGAAQNRPAPRPAPAGAPAPAPAPALTARVFTQFLDAIVGAPTPAEEQRNREVLARLVAAREPGRSDAAACSLHERRAEIDFRRRLRDARATDAGTAVNARANELRHALGPIALEHRPATRTVLASAARDLEDDPELVTSLLLHLAGPYRRRESWLCLPSASFDKLRRATKAAFATAGFVPTDRVVAFLRSQGVADHALEDVRTRLPLRDFGDKSIWWEITVSDKALVLLELHGAPMSADEIWRAIAEGYSAHTISKRLERDPRVTRTAHGRWAPTEWQLPAWDGTDETVVEHRAFDAFGTLVPRP